MIVTIEFSDLDPPRRADGNDAGGATNGSPPYRWSDLLAWRNALGLTVEDLVPILKVDLGKYMSRQTGALEVGPYFIEELLAMADFVADETDAILAAAPDDGPVTLHAALDQHEFESTNPNARTLRDEVPYPVSLQHVAVGRATAELRRQGRTVEVHRGDSRADLLVLRLAAGLLKDETARLLGVNSQKHSRFERSPTEPPLGLMAELQAINDFIAASAAQLKVTEEAGVSIVPMIDNEAEFERVYPEAKTQRDGKRLPRRVHRVAAALRAQALERDGHPARILVRGHTHHRSHRD